MDKAALYQLSSGLYVVGVKDGQKLSGCVINTAMQVTSNPPKVSVTIAKDNYTHDLLARTGYCSVSVLAQDIPMAVIGVFGFQSGKDAEKFADIPHALDAQGVPHLTENNAVAYFAGKVEGQVDLGSHTLFVIEVSDGEVMHKGSEPMTYSYYRQVKNGSVPKNAPSYREPEKAGGWRCGVCGYIHEGADLPEGFTCPICRQPRTVFVQQ